MSANNTLRVNKESKSNLSKSSSERDILHIEKSIESIEKNISDLKNKRSLELSGLADEKNYDIFFYVGTVLVLLNLIFRFTYIGLLIAVVFVLLFAFYKMFFTKQKRAASINVDIDTQIDDLNQKISDRHEEIKKIQEKYN